jgi:hypothetical protein
MCLLLSGRALKNECPQQAKNSRKALQTRGRDQVVKGKYLPTLQKGIQLLGGK